MALIKKKVTEAAVTSADAIEVMTSVPTMESQMEADVLPEWLEKLQSDMVSDRRQAARALVNFPDSLPVLIDALSAEPSSVVREAILSTLLQIGDTDSIQALIQLLGSDDINLRNEVFEVLKARAELSIPMSEALLRDPDPDMRIYAVNLLESMRDPGLEAELIDIIETDPHVNVCAAAINLLGEVGTKASLTALKKLKMRFANEPYIGFVADLTIGRIHECSPQND